MGLRIVLLLLVLVSSAVMVLFNQIINTITVFENSFHSDATKVANHNSSVHLNQKDDNILSFIQMSDLHLSLFEEVERFQELKEFCSINLLAIKPKIVIISGDLTEAISPNKFHAQQYEGEWKMYDEFRRRCQSKFDVEWLDLRGNHDNFNMEDTNSSHNYFQKYGVQGKRNSGSYITTVTVTNSTRYAFIAVDATLDVGPRRMLNFIGGLTPKKLTELELLDRKAAESQVNASIWFGHYPSSSIQSVAPGLRQVAKNAIAYLCGHYHTFLELAPHMYAVHHSGLMELELADWKRGRWYRVGVFDEGLFSFVDVRHKVWPIILVTNPKPAFTVQPNKEPFHLIASSTHIRILIYSPSPVQLCQARIGNETWRPCALSGQVHPLYTLPWQPELYAAGLHRLQVRARDESGLENQVEIEFSLDGSRPVPAVFNRMLLLLDFSTLFQVLFSLAVALCVVPLAILRVAQHRILNRKLVMHRVKLRLVRMLLRKLWMVANIDGLFYPFAFYSLYLLWGPWIVGEIINGRTGIIFAWGAFFGDRFLPGSMSYFHGCLHILTFNVPLLLIIGHAADNSYAALFREEPNAESTLDEIRKHSPLLVFTVFHAVALIPFIQSYGTVAFLLCPMRTWALVMALHLIRKAGRLRKEHLNYAAVVWM